jgi:dihydrofolate reductase
MIISIIAAIGKNRELGKENKLLWHIPEDLKRFKKLTSGHSVIMGRRTFESIDKPLPDRTNIIITRDTNFYMEGLIVVHSLEEAISEATKYEKTEAFIIGGASIYKQALVIADKLYLTIVYSSFNADVFFPEYKHIFKKVVSQEESCNEKYSYSFVLLKK